MKASIHVAFLPLLACTLVASFGVAISASEDASPAPSADSSEAAAPSPNVVARIGEYTITADELKQRLAGEIRPQMEEGTGRDVPTPERVLRTMIAEKAMIMEGRRLNYLESDPQIRGYIEKQRQRRLASMLVQDFIDQNLSISDAEVDQMLKTNPSLDRDRARAAVYRTKGLSLLDGFYKQLLEKSHLKQVDENFAKAAKIHARLLERPAEPRNESWIRNSQVRDELTEEEKQLVLATYDGGRVTLLDWFETLCDIVPPRRPKDLSTPQGVQRLLEGALRPAILVTEAKARGYDKSDKLLQEIRDLEDRSLFGKVQSERITNVTEPNDAEIQACFEKNKERFGDPASLKVDQIWCADLATARKVREMLAPDADFASVRNAHSLQKDSQPHQVYPGGEGIFWNDLWKGEPNDVLGPLKGFYGDGIRWRIVKIVEKTPAKIKPLSDEIKNRVKWAVLADRRADILDQYRKELLEKYQYEIKAELLKDMDPLAVTEGPVESK